MKTIKFTSVISIFILIFITQFSFKTEAQCDSLVPSFIVDLSASPNMSWTSPLVARDGNCCGTTNPDRCLEFIITLHPDVIAISFDITGGAIPPGALYYQVDCGPITPVGEPICLEGVGPHNLTFCKPGNNENEFSITSYSAPVIGPDITLNAACQGFIYANYYNVASVTWTSIAPGAQGDYDGLLSCTSGCDTTYFTAPNNGPGFVDYLVCGDDIGGCNPFPICDTIRVTYVAPVAVSISATQTGLCAGATTTLTANASGGSSPYSYLWSMGETTSSVVVTGGTYYVEVVDTSSCFIATDTIVVTLFPVPPVNAGPDQSVCDGASVTLSGSGAVSYVWDNGVTDGVPFVPALGTLTYTVTGTDANGCMNTDQVDVTVNPMPIVNAGADQTVCEGAAVILSGAGATSYLWDQGITDGVPFTPAVGALTYTVTGTDANGCINTDQVDVTVNPLPIVNAGSDQTVCEGTSVTLNGSGAVSYVWDNGVTDGVAFVPAVGSLTYTVTGTDANGCINTDQVDVTVNPLPVVDAGVDQQACAGSAITLSGSGAVSYDWDNGITDGVPFIQGVGVMTYTVTGTDANGCVNTDQVDVTIFALPVVNAGADQTVCEGTVVTLSGAGATNYSWDQGITDGVPFTPAVGTLTYTVTGTDANGCINTDQVDVTVNPLPVVNAGIDQTVCEGTAVTLNGSGAVLYSWDNGVTDGVPFVPAVGTLIYTVTGTDANGCFNIDQVNVTVNPLPAVYAGVDQQACAGSAITLSGSGAAFYAWDNGVTDGVPFGQGVGTTTYTVTGTDVNGCVNSDQVDVIMYALPIVDGGLNQTVCEGTAVTLNGAGASSYIWNNGVSDGVPFVPAVGTLTYSVIGTDLNGCSNSDQVDVTVNPLPIVNAGLDQTVCEGSAVTLSGSGAQSYAWDNGVTNGVAFVPAVGTLIYTVIGTDANGCMDMDQVNVTVNPLPNVSAGQDQVVCEGTSVTLTGSGAVGYSWNNGVIDGVPFTPAVGALTYTLTGTGVNGCQNTDQVDVLVNPNPVVEAGANQSVCEGTTIKLSATGTPNLYWNNGVINNVNFNQAVGIVTYIVTDSLSTGCTSKDSLTVEVLPNPIVTAEDAVLCEGEGVTLNGAGAVSYVWTGGVIDGVEFFPTTDGSYTVTGTAANGCKAQATANIVVHPAPNVYFKILDVSLTTTSSTTGFENLTTGAVSYSWDFGDGSANTTEFQPVHTFPSESGEYEITLTAYSAYGCPGIYKKYVHVFLDYTIYVPNTFTPDNSGTNDVFKPVLEGFDPNEYTLYIFNRWGNQVFESHDMDHGWDGTINQKVEQVMDGVYTWKIIAGLKDSADTKMFVGHVSLLK